VHSYIKIDEDKIYVLCEFVNEDLHDSDGANNRSVQVAHSDWLVFDGPKIPISSLIEEKKEIIVQWPDNYNVQPKESMAKILADIKWINTVAVLKAQSNGEFEQSAIFLLLSLVNRDLFCN
jgi:hypothetical protein